MFGMKSTEEMMVQTADAPHSTTIVAENGGTEYKTVFTLTAEADGAQPCSCTSARKPRTPQPSPEW